MGKNSVKKTKNTSKVTSNNPKYTTVLFDFDGVVINSIETWIEASLAGFSEIHIPADRKHAIQCITHFDSVKDFGVENLLDFSDRISRLYSQRADHVTPQEHSEAILQELKKKDIKTGLITTSGRKEVDMILKRLDFEKYFDITITYQDVTIQKPNPEGVHKAIHFLQSNPSQTLIIGDTRNDVLAGKAANITTVLYYPELHTGIYDKDHVLALNADYYIPDLRNLLSIVF